MPKITAPTLMALAALTLTGCAASTAEAVPPRMTPAEADFLEAIRGIRDLPDDQLIDAGHAACEQILGGRDIFQVHVFDYETKENGFYEDSVRVALAAAPRLCPELD